MRLLRHDASPSLGKENFEISQNTFSFHQKRKPETASAAEHLCLCPGIGNRRVLKGQCCNLDLRLTSNLGNRKKVYRKKIVRGLLVA